MPIKVTAAAREWLLKQGGVVTIRLSPRHGCCGGGTHVAVAEARTPDDPFAFTRFDSEGLVIYFAPSLEDQALVVDLQGLLGIKKLFVEGVSPTRLSE
ncbi:hypothetical protein KG088_09940 [Halomonas sp. TRM85114]|uniref:CC/Se motif family (seleno)protein n=1 Tax=Halomonas jincaotanensis TaxID=2810616 RepID=UPI001BD5BED2|nr:CC/Se motif family (seleno)protein [Halomonas jincaotanensis]MBS9403950.1 hypothetical protein [Halomonas jincaotanensis]